VPVLALFSAYACVYLVDAFRRKSFEMVRALLILAAAAAFVNSDYLYQKQMRAYSESFSSFTLGNAYLKMGLKATALTYYTRADEISRAYPTDAYRLIERDVNYHLGTLLWEQGMCSRAIAVLERVGGEDELAMGALDHLGDCYLQRRDAANSRRVYERMRAVAPRDERALTGLARTAALNGDFARAESMLRELVDPRYAVYPPSYLALAEIQRAQGKIDEAIESYSRIATLLGYERQGYIALAELYRQKGDQAAALKAATQAALHSPPDDPTIRTLIDAIRQP
jgi:tetratricopeptide (TPR) repeat protein